MMGATKDDIQKNIVRQKTVELLEALKTLAVKQDDKQTAGQIQDAAQTIKTVVQSTLHN